jgi:hypothetical protein
MCENDSLDRTASGAGSDSRDDSARVLSGASTDSLTDSADALTGAGAVSRVDSTTPLVLARESVRLGHVSGVDHSLGFSTPTSGDLGVSLDQLGSSTTLHPIGFGSDSAPVAPTDAKAIGSSVVAPPITSHTPTCPTTRLQQGICKLKIYMDGTIRYGLFAV